MDFKQAVIRCLRDKYVDFNGRAGRSEFWWFALFCLAVGARRLHDMGKSGWFQLLWLVPVLGWAVLIYWLVQPSAVANEYGEGPAAADAPTAAVPPGAV